MFLGMLEVSTASIFKQPQEPMCIQASTEQRILHAYITSCEQFGILTFIQNECFHIADQSVPSFYDQF